MILKIERLEKEKEQTFVETEYIDNINNFEKTKDYLLLFRNGDVITPTNSIYIGGKTTNPDSEIFSKIDKVYLMNDKGQTIEKIV